MNSTYRTVSAPTITGWADRCREEMRRAEAAEAAKAAARYCAICGEPEGSVYAKHCCTDDQMISDDAEEDE